MPSAHSVKLRPLEREDLRYVHQLDNNASVMRYWFEEPYEAFVELSDLYDKHIHDQSERRFVVNVTAKKPVWWSWWKLPCSSPRRISDNYLPGISGERSGNPCCKISNGLWLHRSQSL